MPRPHIQRGSSTSSARPPRRMLRCNGLASKGDAAMQRPGLQKGRANASAPPPRGGERAASSAPPPRGRLRRLGPASRGGAPLRLHRPDREAPRPRPYLREGSSEASAPPPTVMLRCSGLVSISKGRERSVKASAPPPDRAPPPLSRVHGESSAA